MIIKITNSTSKNFQQRMHYNGNPRVINIPRYALNQEVGFIDEAEFNLFKSLISLKLDKGELLLGTSKEREAEKQNEKLEKEEKKEKEEADKQIVSQFEEQVKAQLGDEGSIVEIKLTKGKGKK